MSDESAMEVKLWDGWFSSPTPKTQNALIAFYDEWIVTLSKRFYAKYFVSSYEVDDYKHWATIGLIEAINRYTKVKGIHFKVYAFKRVRGEIMNQINQATERTSQSKARKMLKNEERVTSIVDVSSSGTTFDKLCNVTIGIMLGNLLEEEVYDAEEQSSLINDVYKGQLASRLTNLVNLLPEQQQVVLNYHYHYGLRFSDIADILGVTKGRVSQIHGIAISMTRKYISQNNIELFY
jgi:RNA polymerase sigma factor FliA